MGLRGSKGSGQERVGRRFTLPTLVVLCLERSVAEEDRWIKLEQVVEKILRKVLKEELAQLGKKPKIDMVNGKWIGITLDQREAWSAAYGAVQIDAELAKAAAWCISNPALSPKSNFGRFLNTWLTRQQNQASLRSIPGREAPSDIKVRLCGYCGNAATGTVNGIPHCQLHSHDAMDMKPRRMLGVVAKNVTGER